ncbi:ROK family protein [Pseudomonas sp. HT11]|uniref:ROK family protein n=1 Tax=Pseudomonas sp. HT11 TaxID=3230490 RepID=UPI00385014D7
MYLDNRRYSGHWHNAGEIGHTTVIPGGKACSCGNQGCWSTWGRWAGRSGIGGGSLMILAQISPDYEAGQAAVSLHTGRRLNSYQGARYGSGNGSVVRRNGAGA